MNGNRKERNSELDGDGGSSSRLGAEMQIKKERTVYEHDYCMYGYKRGEGEDGSKSSRPRPARFRCGETLSLSLGTFFHFRSGGGDELWQYVINCVRSGGISPCHIDMRRRDPRCKVQSSTASSFPFCFSQFGQEEKAIRNAAIVIHLSCPVSTRPPPDSYYCPPPAFPPPPPRTSCIRRRRLQVLFLSLPARTQQQQQQYIPR